MFSILSPIEFCHVDVKTFNTSVNFCRLLVTHIFMYEELLLDVLLDHNITCTLHTLFWFLGQSEKGMSFTPALNLITHHPAPYI